MISERVCRWAEHRRNGVACQEEKVTVKEMGGNFRLGSMAVGIIDGVKTAKEFIDEIIKGAEEILKGDNPLANSIRSL